jgi:tetrapyrrole methylase family protein/MazG family protein
MPPSATIVVVGLGPAGPDLLTAAARAAVLESGNHVYFRTGRHPAAQALLGELAGGKAETFDGLYEHGESFAAVYQAIVDQLLAAAKADEAAIVYAVPGSPMVAERTVELLREQSAAAGVSLEVVPGLSFCDLAWARLGVDPVAAGVRLVDGMSFATAAAGDHGPLLVGQTWSRDVLSEIKLAIDSPAPDLRAVVLHHLGLEDEAVIEVEWPDIDKTLEADHLTSLYLPSLASPVAAELMRVAETLAVLRRECPWDRQQTHRSLVRHMLEETYEAMEALEGLGDDPEEAAEAEVHHAAEELGDLLCQVVFHANIAREEGLFDLADVARILADKLIRRHPHVFGDVEAHTADDVMKNWEEIKKEEKARQHVLDGIPAAMPALARAAAIERKLKGVGLGYAATGPSKEPEPAAGQVLLDLARRLSSEGVDAEAELRRALDELVTRVSHLETKAASTRSTLPDLPLAEREKAVHGPGVHI